MNSRLSPVMWSSWFLLWDPSMRILIDSSASIIQISFVLCCPTVQQISLCLWSCKSTKHRWLASEIPTFLRTFYIVRLNSSSVVSRLHTFASLCVSMHQTYVSTYLATLCPVLKSSVLLLISPRPCISIRWSLIPYNESSETFPCIWQFSFSINVPTIFKMFPTSHLHLCR